MKKCPFCAEEVQEEAVVCKHCGNNLTQPSADSDVADKFNGPRTLYKRQAQTYRFDDLGPNAFSLYSKPTGVSVLLSLLLLLLGLLPAIIYWIVKVTQKEKLVLNLSVTDNRIFKGTEDVTDSEWLVRQLRPTQG